MTFRSVIWEQRKDLLVSSSSLLRNKNAREKSLIVSCRSQCFSFSSLFPFNLPFLPCLLYPQRKQVNSFANYSLTSFLPFFEWVRRRNSLSAIPLSLAYVQSRREGRKEQPPRRETKKRNRHPVERVHKILALSLLCRCCIQVFSISECWENVRERERRYKKEETNRRGRITTRGIFFLHCPSLSFLSFLLAVEKYLVKGKGCCPWLTSNMDSIPETSIKMTKRVLSRSLQRFTSRDTHHSLFAKPNHKCPTKTNHLRTKYISFNASAFTKYLQMNVLLTVTTLSIILIKNCIECTNIYTDDKVLGQTVAYKTLDSQSKHELQEEILSVLGLNHKPEPASSIVSSSGPHYLIDMYTSLLDDESGHLKVDGSHGPVVFEGEILTSNSLRAINSSDKIMSFKNQCKFSHFWFAWSTLMLYILVIYSRDIYSHDVYSPFFALSISIHRQQKILRVFILIKSIQFQDTSRAKSEIFVWCQ